MRLVDADALYNGAMKDEYFDYVEHDNHGRESFAYSCAMQRLADAPTIDAIPVEWLEDKMLNSTREVSVAAWRVLNEWHPHDVQAWQKEQEAR